MIVKEPPPGTANIKHWMVVCAACKRRAGEAADFFSKELAIKKALAAGWKQFDMSIIDLGKDHAVFSYRCPECIDAQTIEGRQRSDPNR